MKEKIARVKDSVEEMKASVAQAKEDLKSTGDAAAEKVEAAGNSGSAMAPNALAAVGGASAELEPSISFESAEELDVEKSGNGFIIRGARGMIGEITYAPVDSFTWVLNHTYVTPEYRGRDIAQRLLRRVAEEARKEHKKIIPTCSYAAVQFKRHAEYADVWKQS